MNSSSGSALKWLAGGVVVLIALATLVLALVRVDGPAPATMRSGHDFVEAMGRGDVEAAVALADPAIADGVRRLAKEQPEIWGSSTGSSSVSHRGGVDFSWTGVRQKTERTETYEVKGRDGKVRRVQIDAGGLGVVCRVRAIAVDDQPLLFVAQE